MIQDKTPQEEIFLLGKEKLSKLLSFYKFPLILFFLGLVFLILTLFLLIKTQLQTPEVIFSQESSPSAKAKIRVDVEGAVISPGVYEFMEGERIVDALAKAGGLTASADRNWIIKNLNRAAKLIDGGKIYIPSQSEGKSPASVPASAGQQNLSDPSTSLGAGLLGVTTGKVNINSASSSELEALPGIGPVTAKKIIDNRPYQTIEELKTRKILGASLYDKLKDLLTVY